MHMHTIKPLRALLAGAALLAAAGCASTDPNAVEQDFGNSVRAMQQAQIANPSAPADNDPIDHGDGQRINGAIDAYRKGLSDPAAVKKDLVIGVGN
jgi:type IV pilus biogenesis protein CpaD/CtpE